jgi:hypothetical protein
MHPLQARKLGCLVLCQCRRIRHFEGRSVGIGAQIIAPEDYTKLTTCESGDVAIGDTQSPFPRLDPPADN